MTIATGAHAMPPQPLTMLSAEFSRQSRDRDGGLVIAEVVTSSEVNPRSFRMQTP